jgi:ribose transport system permease protein
VKTLLASTRRNSWVVAVFIIFLILLLLKISLLPNFGNFQAQTIILTTLAAALLAIAQSIIVITGGIDLSVGAMMVLVNCVSAYLMLDKPFGPVVLIAFLVIAMSVALSALTGWVITTSGVPDIVITLATSFVWTGLAILILGGPGGGTAPEFQSLLLGPGGFDFWPPLLWLLLPLAFIWLPLRRSRLGLSMYAVGSNRTAAFLAGVSVKKTRIASYAIAGIFTGLAGLVITANTGSGSPRLADGGIATLDSVAAVVLGGVALTGGVGGVLGPILAAFILFLIPSIMLSLGINPSYGESIKGVLVILVVTIGGWLRLRRVKS